jgi:hypothetical protein
MRHTWLILAGLATLSQPLRAQVPDWYPWHNHVTPTVEVADVRLDPTTGDFVYEYRVGNAGTAQQRINQVVFELPGPATTAHAPAAWEALYAEAVHKVAWYASGQIDPAWVEAHELDAPSYLSEITPGATLTGFELLSLCASSGEVALYVRGYNHTPAVPADYDYETLGPPEIPTIKEDAVPGAVLGPGDCDTVLEWGNRRPATDGFMGVVNFTDGAALPAGPVTVQLRFSRSDEQVDVSTFQAELNRVDVTEAFVTNSRGDKVTVFHLGSSPLRQGKNVLLISVDGVVPGTTRSGTDTDRITFTVP